MALSLIGKEPDLVYVDLLKCFSFLNPFKYCSANWLSYVYLFCVVEQVVLSTVLGGPAHNILQRGAVRLVLRESVVQQPGCGGGQATDDAHDDAPAAAGACTRPGTGTAAAVAGDGEHE